jgi:ribosome-associated toxin RatA of RatAB toxin-antitoxin module
VWVSGGREAWAADARKPHPHQGVIAHFDGEPPRVELNAQEQQRFLKGEPIRKQILRGAGGGRGVAIFRVNAPAEVVWSVIRDYPSYPRWIDSVDKCEIYKRDGDDIYVRFVVSSWGVDVEYFIKHTFRPNLGWATWTLDYARESDLEDSVGFWRVTPLPSNPGHSRVTYSIDMSLRGWVPGFLKRVIVNKGLEEATEWVKVQAEKRYRPS